MNDLSSNKTINESDDFKRNAKGGGEEGKPPTHTFERDDKRDTDRYLNRDIAAWVIPPSPLFRLDIYSAESLQKAMPYLTGEQSGFDPPLKFLIG